MPPPDTATLRRLLDAGAGDDAEYDGKLSNHLPMALVALHRLGAEPARLDAFAAHYRRQRLHPAPPPEPWPAGEPWPSALGDPRAWPAYRRLFNDWLDHEGGPLVLTQTLPTLMRGVGAAAFHGLIRTAYAVSAGHSHELADALAYWACRWFTIDRDDEPATSAGGNGREHEPAVVLAALDGHPVPPGDLIAERMAAVAATPAFQRAAARLRVDREDTLPRLARLAAQRYADSRNFTVLHLATSAHAMRVLLPWLDDEDTLPALRHYARAFIAGHAASSLGRASAGDRPPTVPPWSRIVALAVASDDDHVIKLVDSCREQERAYGGAAWRKAAARAVAGR